MAVIWILETFEQLRKCHYHINGTIFLSLISYYSPFLSTLHNIRGLQNESLRKDTKCNRTPKCEKAFTKLEDMPTTDMLLPHHNPDQPIIVTSMQLSLIASLMVQKDNRSPTETLMDRKPRTIRTALLSKDSTFLSSSSRPKKILATGAAVCVHDQRQKSTWLKVMKLQPSNQQSHHSENSRKCSEKSPADPPFKN
ncbi:unnamed protein product [Hymenolepis diminuta]|uniref:Uncharacterized protein n=1 Tax=Hymenolepis diminuta TaxID=6216 RepID=A0A564Z0B1_HYMDI|nr:unnamed protein product [Hymenolepis diminuta]